MSRALIKASLLKPEIRLAQAVSEFEANLSDEQKVAFRTFKSQSCKAAPNQTDVMRLTAEMDRHITNKFGSQCFGPRFTNFLQGVQQFAALGDVVVGGSQNLVACGVWSVVRMSLLSFVSLSTYVDKLSSLFMAIGRTTPRYQAMALLYPRSKTLQASLTEYYILVVNLCHCLFKFTQKSSLRQFTSSLNDAHLKTLQTDLEKCANSIKEEIHLVEAQENTRSRAWTREVFKVSSHQQDYANKMRVLDLCSKYDHETAWKQTRKVGNSFFYKQWVEYKEWKDCSYSCTLVYTGKLGSGKSVLLANLVDDLNLSTESEQSILAYFFCKHDVRESLQARTILGSLTRQLLCTIPNFGRFAKRYEDTHTQGDIDELLELLVHVFPKTCKAYFVLDGIDECDFDQKAALVKAVRNIQEELQVLVCISFREEPNNDLHLIANELLAPRIISLPEDNPDIEVFVETELERCLHRGLLTIGDPTLILEIQDVLLKGSQGMFLWVALQIQTLCSMTTDHAIREALADLPKDLSETFARILRKSGTNPSLQAKTLQLVLATTRPLTTDELREALSVTPGNATWDPSMLLNNVYSALACCGCLLAVDEEEFTVRVVHHSVKQYVLAGRDDTMHTKFSLRDSQRTMADVIVTYLCYDVFGTELSRTKANPVIAQSAPSRIIQATMESSSSRRNLAIKFLKSRKQPAFDIGKVIAETRSSSQSNKVNQFSFYQYADTHWEDFILCVSGYDAAIFRLTSKLIHLRAPNFKISQMDRWTVCQQAVENGNENILGLLLPFGDTDINATVGQGLTILMLAAFEGCTSLVEMLLSLDHIEVNMTDSSGCTALFHAASAGRNGVVEVMLKSGKVNVNASNGMHSALTIAVSKGYKDVVEVLLKTEKLNVNAQSHTGYTALMDAASEGHKDIVEVLLKTGKVEVNASDGMRTALIIAVSKGHKDVVEVLLKTGKAEIKPEGFQMHTALMEAALKGDKDMTEMMLATGRADVEMKDHTGQTALMMAAFRGHEDVVEVLLRNPLVQVDAFDRFGSTTLMLAASNGHRDVVGLLLVVGGANVHIRDRRERTALRIAAEEGYQDIVQLLRAHGADG